MNILITGGAGFIGSNFIIHLLSSAETQSENDPDMSSRLKERTHSERQNGEISIPKIINLDKLTYAGNLKNLEEIANNPNYFFIQGDIADKLLVKKIIQEHKISRIINFAAESHVDRSIEGPDIFIQTNVIGTQVLLDSALEYGIKRFLHISTDEVYGSIKEGSFTEESPLRPRSPYSASKAAAEHLVQSYFHTFNLPTIITRSSNNYGRRQYPEKLIPLFIKNLLNNKPVPLYATGKNVRDWLHVQDNCEAIDLIFRKGKVGEVYNIGGNCEKTNLEVTKMLLSALGKSEDLIEYVEDRKGHDFRYSLNTSKIEHELGWKPKIPFEKGLRDTIDWYKAFFS